MMQIFARPIYGDGQKELCVDDGTAANRQLAPACLTDWHDRVSLSQIKPTSLPVLLSLRKATNRRTAINLPEPPALPAYLQRYYWWAYVKPGAIRFWDHLLMVHFILFGQYARLRAAAIAAVASGPVGPVLQTACVYGNLTSKLLGSLGPAPDLSVVDVVPAQLGRLAGKLDSPGLHLHCADSQKLPFADGRFSRNLLFFLLHEQPEAVRWKTLAEAVRVLKAGGQLVIVDYDQPVLWHPLRPLLALVFVLFEPFAHDLWQHSLAEQIQARWPELTLRKQCLFGSVYQVLDIRKPGASM